MSAGLLGLGKIMSTLTTGGSSLLSLGMTISVGIDAGGSLKCDSMKPCVEWAGPAP